MKKLSAILIAMLLVVATAFTAFAAGINSYEQAVLDALKQPVVMNGTTVYVPAEYINQAENYFNTIDLTEEESDAIIGDINEGKAFLEASGADNISSLSYEQKEQLLAIANSAAGVVGMTVSFDKTTKNMIVYDADGSVAFTAVPALVTVGSGSAGGSTGGGSANTGVIKTTGAAAEYFGFFAVGAVAVVLAAGSAVYLVKFRKERA